MKMILMGIVLVLGVILLVWMALGAWIALGYILAGTEERERVPTQEPLISTPTVMPTPVSMPTSLPLPTHVPMLTATSNPTSIQGQPRDVSRSGLFSGAGGAALGGDYDSSSVEEVLEQGLYVAGITPVHIAFRGTPSAGSVRCDWRGDARTLGQRESPMMIFGVL